MPSRRYQAFRYIRTKADSENPGTAMDGGLGLIGALEASGRGKGLRFIFARWATIQIAKIFGWTQQQIEDSIQAGRQLGIPCEEIVAVEDSTTAK